MPSNPQVLIAASAGLAANLAYVHTIMVKISILYPNRAGARFDFDYYAGTHIPMAIGCLGTHPGYRGVSVERGVAGAAPGSEPAYTAMCHFLFETAPDFLAAFMPHARQLQDDMPNYCELEPLIQISDVVIAQ